MLQHHALRTALLSVSCQPLHFLIERKPNIGYRDRLGVNIELTYIMEIILGKNMLQRNHEFEGTGESCYTIPTLTYSGSVTPPEESHGIDLP